MPILAGGLWLTAVRMFFNYFDVDCWGKVLGGEVNRDIKHLLKRERTDTKHKLVRERTGTQSTH